MVGRFLKVFLFVLASLCGLYAIFGTKPWQTHVSERHAAGKPAMLDDYVVAGLWEGMVFAGLALLALALTSRWWADQRSLPPLPLGEPRRDLPKRAFWIILTVICAVALPSRIARMDDSFWGDEAWAYADQIHGRTTVREDGSLGFKRHPWKVTAFFDKSTNNHYLYSLGARVCDEIWKKIHHAKPYEFSEASVRVLPLIAGVGSLIAVASLLRQIGFSVAGLAAALALAVHPWHVRYSSEGRGYTMLVLFLILAIICLIKALEQGKWRWWLLFAAMQFCALYTWKAAIHPVALINLAALGLILWQRGRKGPGFTQLMRWCVANVLTLILFVPLFLPEVPQIHHKLHQSQQGKGPMDIAWLQNFWSQLCGGMDWSHGDAQTPFASVLKIAEQYPWFQNFVVIVIPVLAVIGLLRLLLNRADHALLLAAPLLGGLVGFLHFKLTGNEMLKWYLFYTLPFVFALVALALTAVGRAWFRFVPAGAFVIVYLMSAGTQLRALVRQPFQDGRAAADLTRYQAEGRYHMGPSDIVTAGLFRRCVLYDPRMLQYWKGERLRSAELLKQVMRMSDENGKLLRVTVANMGFAREFHADYIALVEDERYFKPLGVFPAAEEYITIYAWEYVSGSLPAEEN